jgi:hypothetical protein
MRFVAVSPGDPGGIPRRRLIGTRRFSAPRSQEFFEPNEEDANVGRGHAAHPRRLPHVLRLHASERFLPLTRDPVKL